MQTDFRKWENGKRGVELYDEAADPHELRNLAADPEHAQLVADMRGRLQRATGPREH